MQELSISAETRAGSGNAVLRDEIARILLELDHVLPGQAPILDFVHHNTLHGYQHLPFEEALAETERVTGIGGYQPESEFRACYRQGRIGDVDLAAGLRHYVDFNLDDTVCAVRGKTIRREDVYRVALLFDLEPITESRLNWNITELEALDKVQPDVPETVKTALLGKRATSLDEKNRVRSLWSGILDKLGLDQTVPHPENLFDLSPEQAEEWINRAVQAQPDGSLTLHEMMRAEAGAALTRFTTEIGDRLTLGGFIRAITGVDAFETVKPELIRICASALDEGMAPWQLPERDTLGLYAGWRSMFRCDVNPVFLELPDWSELVDGLPEDPVEAVIGQLTYLGLPQAKWAGYLRRLALELPGWSGMINWRRHHPGYHTDRPAAVDLADFLAIRLIYDRLWLGQICRDVWKIEAKLPAIENYFRKNLSELMVREALYKGELPEFLAQKTKTLILRARSERYFKPEWQALSDQIRTWQLSPLCRHENRHCHWSSGWRLFRLCQHLGIDAEAVGAMSRNDLEILLKQLDAFKPARRGKVWLAAYERNYRDKLLQAITVNRGRGLSAGHGRQPEAQLVFCMDEREESFRRHLEELNPAVETFGAAGFFGIPMYYKGLDDAHTTPLCPVAVTPAHLVEEVVRPGAEQILGRHRRGHKLFGGLAYLIHHRLRSDPLSAYFTTVLAAPFILLGLLGDTLLPGFRFRFKQRLSRALDPEMPTALRFTGTADSATAQPKIGFGDAEQADRIENLLRTLGLTQGFAPLVCMIAHGSTSLNNPHEAAHDCGACGGRRGGPNARVFAAMANRPEVRKLLAERGIAIPASCRFVGAQHDTCSDAITWYDLDTLPQSWHGPFAALRQSLHEAQRLSAHERCRRFLPAEALPTPKQAFAHVQRRASDLSQVRPEFGHAGNAAAVIGRRQLTRGLFLDRRVFLISYDPAQDPDGRVVENILLTAGPVGAGINLEYYFSTVDNDRFGCGTKIPHNLTGLFGVMEGTGSDLRTGLPRQMIEIHEAMRLQVIVEAKTAVLERIYQRQEALRELIANGWLHLIAIDPESGDVFLFDRDRGFVRWQGDGTLPAAVENSQAAYRGRTGPVAPVLLRPVTTGA
ncbi:MULTISPECIES: DUF2309 domain-containing protein [Methylomicrobium]|uniref:Probable inorganic carbon transporter subunit DabA n=1 Tax=Methylomicrobium album BG8 TaxID=686340 RepID=H8GPU9_METAL|nr:MULTISPECIES: DUF2309 domain-containing protein [Methylomicrobium]EIC29728.1 hypothetical protein Metal_1963 [Methylomicrobium album BG8]